MSVTKVYDGMPLTCEEYWISSGSLVEGHRITVKMRATITDIGSIPNTIESVIITDERGVDVTKNYQIVIKEGLLTVVGS